MTNPKCANDTEKVIKYGNRIQKSRLENLIGDFKVYAIIPEPNEPNVYAENVTDPNYRKDILKLFEKEINLRPLLYIIKKNSIEDDINYPNYISEEILFGYLRKEIKTIEENIRRYGKTSI